MQSTSGSAHQFKVISLYNKNANPCHAIQCNIEKLFGIHQPTNETLIIICISFSCQKTTSEGKVNKNESFCVTDVFFFSLNWVCMQHLVLSMYSAVAKVHAWCILFEFFFFCFTVGKAYIYNKNDVFQLHVILLKKKIRVWQIAVYCNEFLFGNVLHGGGYACARVLSSLRTHTYRVPVLSFYVPHIYLSRMETITGTK